MLQAKSPSHESQPVFVADSVSNSNVWKLSHDGPGGGVHELQRPLVIRLLEAVLGGESWAASETTVRDSKLVDGVLSVDTYLVKPRPSIRTTIHVFGRRLSGCSNCLTYSNLERRSSALGQKVNRPALRTWSSPLCMIHRPLATLDVSCEIVSLVVAMPRSGTNPIRSCCLEKLVCWANPAGPQGWGNNARAWRGASLANALQTPLARPGSAAGSLFSSRQWGSQHSLA